MWTTRDYDMEVCCKADKSHITAMVQSGSNSRTLEITFPNLSADRALLFVPAAVSPWEAWCGGSVSRKILLTELHDQQFFFIPRLHSRQRSQCFQVMVGKKKVAKKVWAIFSTACQPPGVKGELPFARTLQGKAKPKTEESAPSKPKGKKAQVWFPKGAEVYEFFIKQHCAIFRTFSSSSLLVMPLPK